ncbi:MAG: hypothetical protein NWF06_10385 [Candidatus Bathyarchaeota archaeon]|nr:hypothetical protein [Candidatus Bathyarchaeum sp.]
MKLLALFFGFVAALVGGLIYYLVNLSWSDSFGFWLFASPLRAIPFVEEFSLAFLVFGVVLFFVGLFWRSGGD